MNEKKVEKENRIRKIFELRYLGLTIPQILDQLEKEGFKKGISERNIHRDLHSEPMQRFREELMRRQIADIMLSEDIRTRLKCRDKLLEKLFPKKLQAELSGGLEVKRSRVDPTPEKGT